MKIVWGKYSISESESDYWHTMFDRLHKQSCLTLDTILLDIDFVSWLHSDFRYDIALEADKHIFFYDQIKNKQISALNDKLRVLRAKLKQENSCYTLREKIRKLLIELRSLTAQFFKILINEIKRIKKLFFKGKPRNKRFFYRQLMPFLFKNLDDEFFAVLSFRKKTFFRPDTAKKNYHEIQRRSD